MKRLFIFFVIIASAIPVIAQNQVLIDSLESRLKTAETDSIEIQILLEISQRYMGNNYHKAADYAQRAITLAHDSKEIKLEQKAEARLFAIFFNMSDFKSASLHAYNALKLFEASGDSVGIAVMTLNLGAIHEQLEEFDRALEFYLRAQTLLNSAVMDEKTRTSYLTSVYNNVANIYRTKGDYQSARAYYEKTLSLSRQIKNLQTQGIALNNLGRLYLTDLNQPELAYQFLTEGLKVRLEAGNKSEIAKSYLYLAGYYRLIRNYPEARKASDEALKLGLETGSLHNQQEAYEVIMLIERDRGNYKESLEASGKFKNLSDSIQKQQTGSELGKLRLQYDFEKAEQANVLEKSQIRTRFTIVVIVLAAGLLISILIVLIVRSRANQAELKQRNLAQDVEIKNKELTTNIIYLVRKNELINDVAERLLAIKQAVPTDNQKAIQNIILELNREADNDSWKEFEVRFSQVHSDFYEKLRKKYPDLSPSDEKLCAFLRLNMSTKEIAAITKQNVKSLEVARARLRKKLNLTNTSSSLVVHLAKL